MKIRIVLFSLLFCCGAIIFCNSIAQAQTDSSQESSESGSNFIKDNFEVSGELGAYGEIYNISGQESRRPSSTGRLFFRPTLSLFRTLNLNFDFLLSTEGNSAKQSINQFALHPTWGWGRAHIGDFSDMFSEYSLNGILIRGGGFTINPGIFRLSAVGGYTKRGVSGEDAGYDRFVVGGKIGLGTDAGTFVDLLALKIRDDVNSDAFKPIPYDSTNPNASQIQSFQPKPQENLIAGLLTNIKLFDNLINWKTEITGSIITRNLFVQSDSILKLPDAVTKIYKANITSSGDGAIVSNLNLNFGQATIQAGYKYIGSGYTSLGVGSLLSDIQEFLIAPSFNISSWSVALSYSRQNDNLIKQKVYTTTRNLMAGTVSFQPTTMWFSTLMANRQSMGNNSSNDTTKIGFASLMLGTNQMFMFEPGGLVQNISLSYIFQKSGDDSPLRANSKSTIHSMNLGSAIIAGSTITVSPSVGLVSSKVGTTASILTQTYGVAVQHRAFENTLMTTLSENASFITGTKSFRTNLGTNYQWTSSLSVGLLVSMMNFRGGDQTGISFNEFTTSLTIIQRF